MHWLWYTVITFFISYLVVILSELPQWTITLFVFTSIFLANHFDIGHSSYLPTTKRWWNISSFAALFWAIYIFFINNFGRFDISAIIFHLQFGIEGNGEIDIALSGYIYLASVILFAIAVSSLGNIDIRFRKIEFRIGLIFLLFNPMWLVVYAYTHTASDNDKYALYNDYVYPSAHLADIDQHKNLLVIYLESAEKTFSDPVFGDTYAELGQLIEKSTDFTNVNQVEQTNWTVAGMVASQCGIPLRPLSLNTYFNSEIEAKFLPGVTCLGDILSDNGYTLTYMGGADINFAGKGQFYRTHKFQRVLGINELSNNLNNEYQNKWGLYDDTLFELAYSEIKRLRSNDQPFGLFLLTIAGHTPNGYIAKKCAENINQTQRNAYLSAIKCSGYLAHEFLSKLRQNGLLEDTLIVVLSDHLSVMHSQSPLLENLERRNTLFISPPISDSSLIGKAATTMDIFPTILEALDFKLNEEGAAGLGRSLLRTNNQSLIEKYGMADLNYYIMVDEGINQLSWTTMK